MRWDERPVVTAIVLRNRVFYFYVLPDLSVTCVVPVMFGLRNALFMRTICFEQVGPGIYLGDMICLQLRDPKLINHFGYILNRAAFVLMFEFPIGKDLRTGTPISLETHSVKTQQHMENIVHPVHF